MTNAQILLNRENAGEFPKQQSVEWYDIRQNMLTASEIASILDCNIYQTSFDLLIKKLSPIEHITNESMAWGNMFEQIAIKFYEFMKKESVFPIGLVSHQKYKWLGASPDGLLLSEKLLEIKCPNRRSIGGKIPLYYWIQMQIQMEVCNIDECDYFECVFHKYSDKEEYETDIENIDIKNHFIYNDSIIYYKLVESHLKNIKRDKKWFSENVSKLITFQNKLIYYRGIANSIEQLKIDTRSFQKRKRLESCYDINHNAKQICMGGFIKWDNWVSATSIHNYMIDDPMIDWLEMVYPKSNNAPINTFQQCIMKQGLKFEEFIIEKLKNKFHTNEFVTVANYQEAKSYDKYLETKLYIKNRVPIIYQGVLHDYKCKLFGMPDLLVRCDYLNKIFTEKVIQNPSKNKYRVVDIKFITLGLCADGKHLRNSNKNIYAYKSQLYIYNKILGAIQGQTPKKTYILGKTWSYTKCGKTTTGGSFDRAAHINYKDNDKFIRTKTANAIKWIRDLKKNGHSWKAYSRDELKPNMCNVDQRWQHIKKEIATDNNDITLLWYCGPKNRKIAENKGITNWKKYKGITSEMVGVTGDKTSSTLQLIIDMNKHYTILENENEGLIIPKKIKSNLHNWKQYEDILEFYIDFETINDTICENIAWEGSFIFMIGVGVILNDTWVFNCFIAESLTKDGETKMLLDFHKYIEQYTRKKKLWHWGDAEKYLYRNAMNRNYEILNEVTLLTEWTDMLKIFREEPIVARGMLNFSLKSVVTAFYNNSFINVNYVDSDVSNGLDAMVMAYKLYKGNTLQTHIRESRIMVQIKTYNEIDVKALYEIITYLRNNHK